MWLTIWSSALGVSSIIVYWMIGNKLRSSWIFGIISEIGWIIYSIPTKQWGFLVCAFFFAAVYWRNWVKWGKAT